MWRFANECANANAKKMRRGGTSEKEPLSSKSNRDCKFNDSLECVQSTQGDNHEQAKG